MLSLHATVDNIKEAENLPPCTLVLVSSAILRLKLENGLIQQRSADDEEKAEGLRILEIFPLKNAYTPTMSSDKALDLQPSSE